MRFDTGAMRSANRSVSESSTAAVVEATGRPAVSRGNSCVGAVMPPSLAGFGAHRRPGGWAARLARTTAATGEGRGGGGAEAPVVRPYAHGGWGARKRRGQPVEGAQIAPSTLATSAP